MIERTGPEKAPKHQTNLGLVLFLAVGSIMLMLFVQSLIEGDTTAVNPDVQRDGYPLVHAEFERQYLPGFWSEGSHEYTIAVDCPGASNDLTATHAFQVSASSTSNPGHVYLRLKGPMVARSGSDAVVTQFNPAEASSALVILELKPLEEAQQCQATIHWEGHLQTLPRTQLYTIDPGDDW